MKTVCVPPVTSSTTRHSSLASASPRSSCPATPRTIRCPSNLSPLPAKRIAASAWPSPRMLTAKRRAAAIACPVDDDLFRHTSSIGGSSDSEQTALAVGPEGCCSCSTVITATPLAKRPMMSRNSFEARRRRSPAASVVFVATLICVVRRVGSRSADVGALETVEQVPHPAALGLEVGDVLRGGAGRQTDPFGDLDPEGAEVVALGGVVRDQPRALDAQLEQDPGRSAVLARVDRKAEVDVGIDGVVAAVLQLVGLQLGGDPDAAALVPTQVDDDPAARGRDGGHRIVELGAAVAPARAEHVAGQALAVHADEQRVLPAWIALDEREVIDAVDLRPPRLTAE